MIYPILISSQSNFLMQIIRMESNTLRKNSVHPYRLASDEASRYGSTLFQKEDLFELSSISVDVGCNTDI